MRKEGAFKRFLETRGVKKYPQGKSKTRLINKSKIYRNFLQEKI